METKMIEIVIKDEFASLYNGETYFSGYLDEEYEHFIGLTCLTNGRHFVGIDKEHILKQF